MACMYDEILAKLGNFSLIASPNLAAAASMASAFLSQFCPKKNRVLTMPNTPLRFSTVSYRSAIGAPEESISPMSSRSFISSWLPPMLASRSSNVALSNMFSVVSKTLFATVSVTPRKVLNSSTMRFHTMPSCSFQRAAPSEG